MRALIAATALLLITACGTEGPAGAQGPTGGTGPTGATGPTGPPGTIDRANIYCRQTANARAVTYPAAGPYDLYRTTVSCDSAAHNPLTGSCFNFDPVPPGFWLSRSEALNWSDTTVVASWVCEWRGYPSYPSPGLNNATAEICCVP